jgi:hypothetical protein
VAKSRKQEPIDIAICPAMGSECKLEPNFLLLPFRFGRTSGHSPSYFAHKLLSALLYFHLKVEIAVYSALRALAIGSNFFKCLYLAKKLM